MVKFFRKIRQQLLTENKFSKYLIYGIGEIILVIIGILLALQINNWNEDRKTKILEIKTLKELRSDLVQNLSDINGNIVDLGICKKSNEIIIYHLENNLPYNDSLNYYFANLYRYIAFSANQTTYDNLRQIGFNLISNDSLRASISDLYANQYNLYRHFENTYMVEHHNNYIKPMFMTEFTSFEYETSLQPKNYDQFIKNTKYKQTMKFTVVICNNFLRSQSKLKTNVEKLIRAIDKEIDN